MISLLRKPLQFPQSTRTLFFGGTLVVTLVLVIIVGYFVHGGLHGLYVDDYARKSLVVDPATGGWRFYLDIGRSFYLGRPLEDFMATNLAYLLPDHELPVRLALLGVHLLNVFMLGLLVDKVSGSRFMAILTGALFLVPVFASEAVLWFSAALPYGLALFCLLIGFHCFLACQSTRRDIYLLAGGSLAWFLMVLLHEPAVLIPLLLPIFIWALRSRGERISYRVAIIALVVSYGLIGAYLLLVLKNAPRVSHAGGLVLNPFVILFNRVPHTITGLVTYLTNAGIFGPLREAVELGQREWLAEPGGWILLGALVLSLAIVSLMYQNIQERAPSGRRDLVLILSGALWICLAFGPILLLLNQNVNPRLLYMPSAGFAVATAAFLDWLVHLPGKRAILAMRVALLLTGVVLFISSLTMAGLTRTYQLRWGLDQKQIAAFRSDIPSLPDTNPIWLVPIILDEQSVRPYFGRTVYLDSFVYGVFEAPFSASAAIRMEYGRGGVSATDPILWHTPSVQGLKAAADGQVVSVNVRGQWVPVERLLAFTYRGGQVILLNPMVLSSQDGSQKVVVNLPLVAQLARPAVRMEPINLKLERF